MFGIVIILMFLSPLIVVMLFQWWMKRKTGYDVRGQYGRPMFRRDDIDFLRQPNFYEEEKSRKRESKSTPHYDALVDAEWEAANASRLEDAPAAESDEPQSFATLLKKEEKE